MASWSSSPSWTYFDNINGGQQFSNMLSPEDLNALAENIAYLYENQGENEYLGEYTGGSYRAGAIVKYSDGNIYMCIKDTDDEQEPTNATYWQMLNTASGGEVIPEFTEVDDFAVFAEADGDGSLLVGYDVSQKVALPAGSPARLASLSDEDFIADNIRKGKNIFGLTGEYEGEGGGVSSLAPPTITLDGTVMTITDTNGDAVTHYEIYVDDMLLTTVAKGESVDLAELDIFSGSYSITVKARATSEESNSVTYVSEKVNLLGTWVFNDTIPAPSSQLTFYVDFTANGRNYNAILLKTDGMVIYHDVPFTTQANVYTTNNGWVSTCQAITITSINESNDNTDFIEWLVANATKDTTTDTQALNIITEGE